MACGVGITPSSSRSSPSFFLCKWGFFKIIYLYLSKPPSTLEGRGGQRGGQVGDKGVDRWGTLLGGVICGYFPPMSLGRLSSNTQHRVASKSSPTIEMEGLVNTEWCLLPAITISRFFMFLKSGEHFR
jgi:hypothetical protein